MTEQAVASLAQTALAIDKGEAALAALEAYPNTQSKPALLLLRAGTREKSAAAKGRRKPLAAAAIDYLNLYYRFPLNDEAKAAGLRIPVLQFALGEAIFPARRCRRKLPARRPSSLPDAGMRLVRNMRVCSRNSLAWTAIAPCCALRNATYNRAAMWNC